MACIRSMWTYWGFKIPIDNFTSMYCCRWLSLQFSPKLIFIDIFCDGNYLIAFLFPQFLRYCRWAAARAKIIGSQEVHIKKGSTISLTCMVNIYGSAISWWVFVSLMTTLICLPISSRHHHQQLPIPHRLIPFHLVSFLPWHRIGITAPTL